MSILFLFGAGASNGSLDCSPHPPPLGYQLFDELQKAGGIATTIVGELADLFRQDFEKGMDTFIDERNTDIAEFLRDMARYFVQFKPGPNNIYRKLLNALRRSRDEYIFSTLNYDLLIDLVILQSGFSVSYSAPSVGQNYIPLLKMHGSCNFLPSSSVKLRGVKFKSFGTGVFLESPVRAGTPQDVTEFCQREDSISPAIAVYARSKWIPICRKFIRQQQEDWELAIYQAKRIIIIGASVQEQDTHIWDPLEKSLGFLTYIDPNPEQFLSWAKKRNRALTNVILSRFEDAIPTITQLIDEP